MKNLGFTAPGVTFGVALVAICLIGFRAPVTAETTTATPAAPRTAAYSAARLYNQANAYARSGKTGLAVLNYERARLLEPDNPDIDANLRHVRAAAHLPLNNPTVVERALTSVSPAAAAWVGLLGVILIGVALLAPPRYRAMRRGGAIVGIFLAAWTIGNAVVLWPTVHSAVVLSPDAPARVTPVLMGDSLFTLPEGESVRITADHEDFVLIRTAAGRAGWVARANLAPVVPQ